MQRRNFIEGGLPIISVRPIPNGSAEPSVKSGRTGSAELFGQIAEPPNLKNTWFWRKKWSFSVKFEWILIFNFKPIDFLIEFI